MALPQHCIDLINRVRQKYPDDPADAVPDGHMRLTREMIHAGRSAAGGWKKAQLACIGIEWSELKRKGWIDRACGRLVRDEDYQRFLAFASPTRTLFDEVA